LKQLYASAAVIGLQMIGSQDWTTFIPDILSLSQDSNENLNAVLEILSVLSKELQAKKMSHTQEYVTTPNFSAFHVDRSKKFSNSLGAKFSKSCIISSPRTVMTKPQ